MNLHKLPFDIYATKSEESDSEENVPQMELESEVAIDVNDEDNVINNIPEKMIEELKKELEVFYKDNPILKNILVSTADGFEVASILTPGNELHVRKVSALASSLLGISSAMLKEVGNGDQNTVFMESDDSMILFNRICVSQNMMCLMAVTKKDEPIGQIFWRVKNLSEKITDICTKFS